MSNYDELSLEQQYSLRVFSEQVKTLSKRCHQNLIELYRQMMIRDNYYRKATRVV